MQGGSSLLGSCCVLGRGLAWGRAGLREEGGSAWRSEKLLRVAAWERGWGTWKSLGGEGAAGSEWGCWGEEALLRDEEDKKCIEYRLLFSFSFL